MTPPIFYQAIPGSLLWDGAPGQPARQDPMTEGEYLIPGCAVLTEPPALQTNQAARLVGGAYTGPNQLWEVIDDFVGVTYWDPSTWEPKAITELGIAPPAGYLLADPGPTLEQAKAKQVILMESEFMSAMQNPVPYTTLAGAAGTFYADQAQSVPLLTWTLLAYQLAGALPVGFTWKTTSGVKLPVVYKDLQLLAQAIADQAWTAYQKRDSYIEQIQAITAASSKVADVQSAVSQVAAVVWVP